MHFIVIVVVLLLVLAVVFKWATGASGAGFIAMCIAFYLYGPFWGIVISLFVFVFVAGISGWDKD